MTSADADSLWQQAQSRWGEIQLQEPTMEPAIRLQRALIRELIDTASELDRSGITPPAWSADIAGKLEQGLPAWRGESVPIPEVLKSTLLRLCDTLATGDTPDSALHIKHALASGVIDSGSLIAASLGRNQKAIRTTSIHVGLSPDLMWLVGELGASPLANGLQRDLACTDSLADALRRWDRGYCPFCGSWPALIEVHNRARILRCSFCSAGWDTRSNRCIYCGDASAGFVAAAPDIGRTSRRLDLCGQCAGYTKVIEVEALTPFPLIAIEDLASVDLDQGAMERGYRRPMLHELNGIDPVPDCEG